MLLVVVMIVIGRGGALHQILLKAVMVCVEWSQMQII